MHGGFESIMLCSSRRLHIAGCAPVVDQYPSAKSPCRAMHGMSCSDCSFPTLSPDAYSSVDGIPWYSAALDDGIVSAHWSERLSM